MQPNPIAFTLLGVEIRWYGILIGIGFLLGIFISYYRAPKLGIKPDHVLDFAILMIPLSIIGARAYYVIFEWEHYKGSISKILDIRSGGLAIHGGLIVGIIVCYLVCKYHKISVLNLLDLVFPQVALGQSIGRWGNYFNSEAHGGPTDLPWGIMVDGVKVHPTFLYESLLNLICFIILMVLRHNKKIKTGTIVGIYLIWYGIVRFFIESLRTDSLMLGSLRMAQLIGIPMIIIGIVLLVNSRKRNRYNEVVE